MALSLAKITAKLDDADRCWELGLGRSVPHVRPIPGYPGRFMSSSSPDGVGNGGERRLARDLADVVSKPIFDIPRLMEA